MGDFRSKNDLKSQSSMSERERKVRDKCGVSHIKKLGPTFLKYYNFYV